MNAREVLAAIDGLQPAVQQAYLDQIAIFINAVTLAEVERALQEDDNEALLLGIFALLIEQLRTAFIKGGTQELKGARVAGLIIGKEFDAHADQAASFLRNQSRELLGQVTADQAQAIQAVLSAGQARGQSTRKTALDLIGRVSKQTGKRTGGALGLGGNFATSVTAAKDELLSGDPAKLKKYLSRTRRDPVFDKVVKEAIEGRQRIGLDVADRIAGRYASRLLETQAQMIAETFTSQAFNEGRDQAWRQIADKSKVPIVIEKTWRSKRDEKVRLSHSLMNGQKVAQDQPFASPHGSLLMFPCDASLGAPLSERARCRCVAEYSAYKALTRHP